MNLRMQYTSRKDTLFSRYFCCFRFCSKVSGRLGNVVCRTSLSAVPSLLNHNMYAVSVSEDGGFGLTKVRFNIEEEW